jgi:hypothetical protein
MAPPVIVLGNFKGEVPKLPGHLLPESGAQYALNCDFMHGELRGVRDMLTFASMVPLNSEPMRAVWTQDGTKFYAWPWDVDVVKGQVVGDTFYRIYYSGLPNAGPVLKVARTHRNDDGAITAVIGSDLLVGNGSAGSGNFKPPEASNGVVYGGNGLGPDSWLLGIPAPKVQNSSEDDTLAVELVDKTAWPNIPNLRLRVTLFWETANGEIAHQIDVSNDEVASIPNGATYNSVFYSNDTPGDPTHQPNERAKGRIQDMLWPLGYTPRPYKYYWCQPPTLDSVALSRTVTVLNTGSGDIVIDFAGPPSGTTDNGGSQVYTEQA